MVKLGLVLNNQSFHTFLWVCSAKIVGDGTKLILNFNRLLATFMQPKGRSENDLSLKRK